MLNNYAGEIKHPKVNFQMNVFVCVSLADQSAVSQKKSKSSTGDMDFCPLIKTFFFSSYL